MRKQHDQWSGKISDDPGGFVKEYDDKVNGAQNEKVQSPLLIETEK